MIELSRKLRIGSREISEKNPIFFVAEIGINHDGDYDLALELMDRAMAAGADAVKFQTFKAGEFLSPHRHDNLAHTSSKSGLYGLFESLEFSEKQWAGLKRHADRLEIPFISTPLGSRSARLLHDLEVPAFKLASADLTYYPLLRQVASFGKPLLLSTGMAELKEIKSAVKTLKEEGNDQVALLHCVSVYPAPLEELNLRSIQTLRSEFGGVVGFSDHSDAEWATETALAALVLGARILERHFTLDRSRPGPDHALSLDPAGFGSMVQSIRRLETALGCGQITVTPSERPSRLGSRRSLVLTRHLGRGEALTEESISLLRPGTGLPPEAVHSVLGNRVSRDLSPGEVLRPEDLLESSESTGMEAAS